MMGQRPPGGALPFLSKLPYAFCENTDNTVTGRGENYENQIYVL